MKYIVYKTTCLKNDKIYIGQHRTEDPEIFDDYYGSGVALLSAIKLYGYDNIKRETLFIYDDLKSALAKEAEIVDLEFLKRKDVYNLCEGGRIKINPISLKSKMDIFLISKYMSIMAKKRIKEKPHTLPNNKGRRHFGKGLSNIRLAAKQRIGLYQTITDGSKKKIVLKSLPIPDGWKLGGVPICTKQTEEAKAKIANHENIKGITNYTNGVKNLKIKPFEDIPPGFYRGMTQNHVSRVWITDGVNSKQHDVSEEIPEGWKMGRVFKQKEIKKNDDALTLEKLRKMSQLKDFDNLQPISNVTVTKIKHNEPQELYCLAVPGKAFWIKSNDKVSVTGNTMHCDFMIKVFREYLIENSDEWTDETKSNIYNIAKEMVDLEDKFLDLAFDMVEVDRLEKKDVKQYIRYIADRRLLAMGMKPIFKVKDNPLPWVEAMLGASHTNFFEQKVTDYAKGALTGSWDDVWGSATKETKE